MLEVIPGILEKDWEGVEEKIRLLSPFAKILHIDIIDGKFAPNTTFLDPSPFARYASDFLLELHMMVDNPVDYIDEWVEVGFRRMLGHIEGMEDIEEFKSRCKELGVEAGLVIDGPTAVDEVLDYIDDSLDAILVMTIKAGFSGQAFLPEHLEKVKALRSQTSLPIEVDGGVSIETIKLAKEAGATRFACTSAIFGQPDPHKAYLALQQAIA